MKGYKGKLLEVDLEKEKAKERELKEELAKKYLGGSGLAAKLLYNQITKDLDPLGPENPLAFINGPFVGGQVPSAGRHAVCAKSPLTGIWGESNSGGFFGTILKMAGYDGVIINGRAEDPVYISIVDEEAEIKDASENWGSGFYETQDALKEEAGSKRARVAAIGQAGENQVRYAAVMNDHGRAAGRTGMGAVMGSKNLKGILADGAGSIDVADSDALREHIDEATDIPLDDLREYVNKSSTQGMLGEFGSSGYTDIGMTMGDVPSKFFNSSIFPTDDIDATKLREKYNPQSVSCFGCPIGCGRVITEPPEMDVEEIDGPEYETVAAFGPLNMNFDLDSIVRANHLCNDYGLDTISAGVSIAFAVKMVEDGRLSKDDVGLDLGWGESDAIVELVGKIAKREGFGDKLAEGVRRMADEFGVSKKEVPHVNGMEIPMHDPRASTGQAVSYATSPRGADHMKGDYFNVDISGADVPEIGVVTTDRFESSEEKGAMAARYQNLRELFDALPLCKYSPILKPSDLANILNDVTGWDYSGEELLKTGERIFNIKRLINWKLGVRRKDERIPGIAKEPLPKGSTAGQSPDMETLLDGYYKERKWELDSGKPKRVKMKELGLSEEAKEIYNS